jgi:hypothetical protein
MKTELTVQAPDFSRINFKSRVIQCFEFLDEQYSVCDNRNLFERIDNPIQMDGINVSPYMGRTYKMTKTGLLKHMVKDYFVGPKFTYKLISITESNLVIDCYFNHEGVVFSKMELYIKDGEITSTGGIAAFSEDEINAIEFFSPLKVPKKYF